MKNNLFKTAISLALIVVCCSSCSLSENGKSKTSQQSGQQSTEEFLTSSRTTANAEESSITATTVEKVSNKTDKLFQNASKNKPVVTINGRVITEFEYLLFEWQYDYANLSDKEIKERVICDVLISQQAEKPNLKISEETSSGIIWLRSEESFTSEESEKNTKCLKKSWWT